MKKIFYWSPYLTNVATIKAVINSIKSIKKYSKDYEPILINSCGEFEDYKKELKKLDIKIIDLVYFNYYKFLPTKGFLKSRFSFLIIFIISFIPLLILIKLKRPNFFICHLITSLPIIISNIIKANTKFILRISGLPKYNLFRKFIWKKFGKNIYKVTCPTNGTVEDLKSNGIFDEKKIFLLKDPIIEIKKISKLKNEKNEYCFNNKDYLILSIGRLTKQKNFIFLVKCFQQILQIKKKAKLLIIGEGEEKNEIQNLIEEKNLSNKIILLGYQKNVYKYLKSVDLFVLSSLWEDPGWVLIEAAACNTLILSSNCKNGPEEFIEKNKGGILFEKNSYKDFIEKFKSLTELNQSEIFEKKVFAKKKTKFFTNFNHYQKLNKILR